VCTAPWAATQRPVTPAGRVDRPVRRSCWGVHQGGSGGVKNVLKLCEGLHSSLCRSCLCMCQVCSLTMLLL